MKLIKVMPGYHCWPLWEAGDAIGDIDPATLPVSGGLQTDLIAWADEFDTNLNRDDPAASGFATPEARVQFDRRGAQLAERLATELLATHRILYFSVTSRSVRPVSAAGAV